VPTAAIQRSSGRVEVNSDVGGMYVTRAVVEERCNV
jgi:hypothetical protein